MVTAFVAVGSNINPESNVSAAIRLLASKVEVANVSTVYCTRPLNRPEQPDFYNCVVEIHTSLPPKTLKFEVLRKIETGLGRQRTTDNNAARTIDLDLILYGDLVLKTDGFTLPDPEIFERPFLAISLAELAPHLKFPGTGTSAAEVAGRLGSSRMLPLKDYTARIRGELHNWYRQKDGER